MALMPNYFDCNEFRARKLCTINYKTHSKNLLLFFLCLKNKTIIFCIFVVLIEISIKECHHLKKNI